MIEDTTTNRVIIAALLTLLAVVGLPLLGLVSYWTLNGVGRVIPPFGTWFERHVVKHRKKSWFAKLLMLYLLGALSALIGGVLMVVDTKLDAWVESLDLPEYGAPNRDLILVGDRVVSSLRMGRGEECRILIASGRIENETYLCTARHRVSVIRVVRQCWR